jgi:hypothetical protein
MEYRIKDSCVVRAVDKEIDRNAFYPSACEPPKPCSGPGKDSVTIRKIGCPCSPALILRPSNSSIRCI